MKKHYISFSNKFSFILFFTFLFVNYSAFSQCTNPNPTGSSLQEFCKSDDSTISDLVALGGVTIAWFDALTSGNQYSDSAPLFDGTTYYADIIDGGNCSPNRLEVIVAIYGNAPMNVDVFVGKCASDGPTIAGLSADGSDIRWYDAQTNGNLLPPATLLVDGNTYWVQQTENGCTSIRLPTIVTVIDPPPPTVAPEQSFCSEPIPRVSDLSPSGADVLWYESQGSTEALTISTPLVEGEDYWATQVSFPCESTERSSTIVSFDTPPNAGISGSYTECEIDLVVTDLFSLLGGTPDTTGTWSGPSTLTGDHLGTFTPGTNTEGTYTYTVSSNLGVCPDQSANVTVAITMIPPPMDILTTQDFCESDNPTVANLTPNSPIVLWYDSESSTTPLAGSVALANGVYWASQVDSGSGCQSVGRIQSTISIDTPPNAGISGSYTECEIDLVTTNLFNLLSGTPDTTGTWSGPSTLTGDHLGTFTPGTNTEGTYTYTVSSNLGVCPDQSSNVTVAITMIPPPMDIMTTQDFCASDNPTVANLTPNSPIVFWYDSESSTTPLAGSVVLTNGVYWASQVDSGSGCQSVGRIQSTISIDTPPNAGISGSYTECEIDLVITDLFSLLSGAPDNTGTWSGPSTLTGDYLGTFTPGTNTEGTYTYTVSSNLGVCPDQSATVTVAITMIPPPMNILTTQDFCASDDPTVANLTPNSPIVLWYDSESSTTPLEGSVALANGVYWASQVDSGSGCQSVGRIQSTISIESTNAGEDSAYTVCQADATITNLFDLLGGTPDINGTWNGPSTLTGDHLGTYDPAVNTPGDYIYTVISSTGNCPDGASTITVSITSITPVIILNPLHFFCASEMAKISDLNATGTDILWFDTIDSDTPLDFDELLVDGEDYWAVQSDSLTGCISSIRIAADVTLTNISDPILSSLGNEFCIIDNPTLSDLDANVSPASSGTITWYGSFPNGSILNLNESLVEGVTYYAIETDSGGCTNINPLAVTVTLDKCDDYDVEIYDGFSPTGNGINDTFVITNLKELYPDFKVEFYNRWGNKVHTANANKPDWNGRLNGDGELVPAGVYYFIIYFNKDNRKPIQRRLYISR